jgi:hypothetical protein
LSAIYFYQVSEDTVLTDPTGLHLGAGPYLLLYSKAMLPEHAAELQRLPWPDKIKVNFHGGVELGLIDASYHQNSAKHNNIQFLSQIKQEVASQVLDFNSPPTSPMNLSAPLPRATESNDTPEQSQELMDLS